MNKQAELGIVKPSWPLPAPDPEVKPWESAPHREWQTLRMETYAAMVTRMDRDVGRLVGDAERSEHVAFDAPVVVGVDVVGAGVKIQHEPMSQHGVCDGLDVGKVQVHDTRYT